jgi:prephenate dehydrogenase
MPVESVGIVGYGAFGVLVHELLKRFAPEVQVKVSSVRFKPDGKTFYALEEVAACNAVVLCVPMSAFEETLKKIKPHLAMQTIVVDVATVKEYTGKLLKKHLKGWWYISAHPMWGPESYKKKENDVKGLRIVITESNVPRAEYHGFVAALQRIGFNVVEMTAKQHDKHLAETLFLTHFLGQTITEAKFDRTEIDTLSFGFLMDAVESVRHDKALFQDVFKYVPECKAVLRRLDRAEKLVKHRLSK